MLLLMLLTTFLQQPPDLIRILEATQQEWTGGREETGKGVNYEIKLVVKKNAAKLKFVSITVDQQACDFKVSNINHPDKGNRYHNGDTLLISALLKNPPGQSQKKEKPYPVIGYSYKKSILYYSIRQGMSLDKNNYR